jgi:hypothetical protein
MRNSMKNVLSILLAMFVGMSAVGCVREPLALTINIRPMDKALWSTVSISDDIGDNSPFGFGVIVENSSDFMKILSPCHFQEKASSIITFDGQKYKIKGMIQEEERCFYITETTAMSPLYVANLKSGSVNLGDRLFAIAYGSSGGDFSGIRLYSEYVVTMARSSCDYIHVFLLTDPNWEWEGSGIFNSSGDLVGMVDRQVPTIF